MVAAVAALGAAHPLARLPGECGERLRRERRPRFLHFRRRVLRVDARLIPDRR